MNKEGGSRLFSGRNAGWAAPAIVALALLAGDAAAVVPVKPIVTENQGMVIDWSRNQLRFAGRFDSAEAPASREGLAGLDRKARFNGYDELYRSSMGKQLLAAMSRDSLRRMVRSSNTEYYNDGDVIVNLRMDLGEAFARFYANPPKGSHAAQAAMAPKGKAQPLPKGKPLVIVVDQPLTPQLTYVLKGPSGTVRHSLAHMAPAAFKRNLMASWHSYPKAQRNKVVAGLQKSSGQPVLEAHVADGALIIDMAEDGAEFAKLRRYLVNGKVQILVPRSR